jgi:ABC-type branched-subunit amino acid transport system substrate-binding protein
VGSESLSRELGPAGDGVIITQVVPHFESELTIAEEFRSAFDANEQKSLPNFGSFEGYVAARILIRALRNLDRPPSREDVVSALEALGEFDIGLGIPLRLDVENHQASHGVWPTVIRNGRVEHFDWQLLKQSPASAGP